MRMAVVLILLSAALVADCARDVNADLWDCQLSVQKENAGKDVAAAAERMRAIEACMDDRGYRLKAGSPTCLNGSVDAGCYTEK